MTDEQTLYESHPAMFQNHPFWFVISVLLCAAGVGLAILLIWWLGCKGTTLTVTDKRTILQRGLLSRYISEVLHRDVRNIQLSQTFFQRVFGVGSIGISSAAEEGTEIRVTGIPRPDEVRALIDAHRE